MKSGLFQETVVMALDTLRTQKVRSALTVLGVLIGVTSIVGMTAIVRGFDESLRESIRAIGRDTIYVSQFSGFSLASGEDFSALMRRPSLTPDDAKAIETAYLAVLTRCPTDQELAHFVARLDDASGQLRRRQMEDIYWSLLNSTEFSWNH